MSPKNLRPQLEPKASERMARVWIILVLIGVFTVAVLMFTGRIKPYRKQSNAPESTPIPEPPRVILPPQL